MDEQDRTFYRLAQERGTSLARAQDQIDDLIAERDGLRTALKGFTDVLGEFGISDTDGLREALGVWKKTIPDGTAVYLITTVSDEYDGQPYIDMRTALYDSRWMSELIGTRVFPLNQREAAEKALAGLQLKAIIHDRGLENTHEIRDDRIVPKAAPDERKQEIPDGSDVWIIQAQEWGGDPGKLEIVRTKYDRTMAGRVGDRVFASAEAASSRMRELMLAACRVRA